MTSPSEFTDLTPEQRREYGSLRVRDAAFDAVSELWRRRQSEVVTQVQIANSVDADAGWVSKNLRGPANWTMKTFGTFVEALNGEVKITIRAMEDPLPVRTNYHAYVDYGPELPATTQVPSGVRTSISAHSLAPNAHAVILIP